MATNSHKLTIRQKIYRFFKAAADFFVAAVSLVLLSPLFAIVAIAIKADSKGPVFFSQERIGKNGKIFKCIKFRSMYTSAKHDVAGYEYAEAGSYITKVGAWLRKYSIDELPQLFNMLTFKMSLIGYRPSQQNETELNDARENYDMYQIRPGITGWAQVNGRDVLAAQPTKKAAFDNYYLEHFSLWLDIKIFFMTIFKVFRGSDVKEGVIENDENKNESRGAAATDMIAAGNRTGGSGRNVVAAINGAPSAEEKFFALEKERFCSDTEDKIIRQKQQKTG